MTTESTINLKLNEIEEAYNVRVVRAADYGSRSWNLHSENSDYDVGFIFYQPDIAYKSPGLYRENLDEGKGEFVEFTGWNVKRFAELLNDSNPMAVEFLNSNAVYRDYYPDLFEDIRAHANQHFKPIAMFYHYRSMAKQNYTKYISEEQAEGSLDQTVKRHLYVVRGLLYARYIEATHEFPPLDFMEFLDDAENLFCFDETCADQELCDMVDVAREWAEQKKKKKKNGNGDEEIGNPHKAFFERELDDKLDGDEHTVNGISARKVAEMVHCITETNQEHAFRELRRLD